MKRNKLYSLNKINFIYRIIFTHSRSAGLLSTAAVDRTVLLGPSNAVNQVGLSKTVLHSDRQYRLDGERPRFEAYPSWSAIFGDNEANLNESYAALSSSTHLSLLKSEFYHMNAKVQGGSLDFVPSKESVR